VSVLAYAVSGPANGGHRMIEHRAVRGPGVPEGGACGDDVVKVARLRCAGFPYREIVEDEHRWPGQLGQPLVRSNMAAGQGGQLLGGIVICWIPPMLAHIFKKPTWRITHPDGVPLDLDEVKATSLAAHPVPQPKKAA
jgi:hypothetical protein